MMGELLLIVPSDGRLILSVCLNAKLATKTLSGVYTIKYVKIRKTYGSIFLPVWDSCFARSSRWLHPTADLSTRSLCTPNLPPKPLTPSWKKTNTLARFNRNKQRSHPFEIHVLPRLHDDPIQLQIHRLDRFALQIFHQNPYKDSENLISDQTQIERSLPWIISRWLMLFSFALIFIVHSRLKVYKTRIHYFIDIF